MSKIRRSGQSNKEGLELCLIGLIEDDAGVCDESEDWIKILDRGGLLHAH